MGICTGCMALAAYRLPDFVHAESPTETTQQLWGDVVRFDKERTLSEMAAANGVLDLHGACSNVMQTAREINGDALSVVLRGSSLFALFESCSGPQPVMALYPKTSREGELLVSVFPDGLAALRCESVSNVIDSLGLPKSTERALFVMDDALVRKAFKLPVPSR